MTQRVDSRRDPRYEIHRPVRVIPPRGEAISGTTHNLSRGGMLVALPIELELGRTYRIEVSDSQGTFSLQGEALRLHLPPRSLEAGQQAAEFGIGFEFVGIDPPAAERLGRLLEEEVG